jgi:membrane protease YdiL (CAAX protease family)
MSILVLGFLGRSLSTNVASQSGVVVFFSMLLFFMGGIWCYPLLKERDEAFLLLSVINQLSCLAFMFGVDRSFLSQGSTQWKQVTTIVVAVLFGIFSVIGSTIWVSLLMWLGIEHDAQEMVFLLTTGDRKIQIGTIVFVVLIAPFVEEILFRNLLLSSFMENMSTNSAILLTAGIFGLMHLESWTSVPPLIVFGIILGVLRIHYKSIIPSIIAHVVNNSIVVLSLFYL